MSGVATPHPGAHLDLARLRLSLAQVGHFGAVQDRVMGRFAKAIGELGQGGANAGHLAQLVVIQKARGVRSRNFNWYRPSSLWSTKSACRSKPSARWTLDFGDLRIRDNSTSPTPSGCSPRTRRVVRTRAAPVGAFSRGCRGGNGDLKTS